MNRGEGKAFVVIPIESLEDGGYNPDFVKKILAADISAKNGNTTRINDVENIWADIL
ncbi:hypothetical protein I5M32_04470 [Pedobacter sp. SD-b]|uniref:Uncharacterized protein n=1 Tax=Pedobacter segetis TaxID=2793069 RepID=A0ABS1BHF8_9SPHI|nr:DUF2683 family protein [Pedobacter segetis]MBK0382206.1 hypothetical protein [Pedobacter segetis]